MKKLFAITVLALAFVASAFAQTYNTPNFSATFNGPVKAGAAYQNDAKTSTTTDYCTPLNLAVVQCVDARFITAGVIPVDNTSSDFYLYHDTFGGNPQLLSHEMYQGHPASYAFFNDGKGNGQRERVIIVSPTEVLFILQYASANLDDSADWTGFAQSLDIK